MTSKLRHKLSMERVAPGSDRPSSEIREEWQRAIGAHMDRWRGVVHPELVGERSSDGQAHLEEEGGPRPGA